MSVKSWGDRLPPSYLESFKPTPGVSTRVCILESKRILALESHFLDHGDIKGMFQCVNGLCCVNEGQKQQRYIIPVWVYNNPQLNAEGVLKAWSFTGRQYEALSKLYPAGTLDGIDLNVIAQKSGQRVDISYTPLRDTPLLLYLPQETIQALQAEVENFYARGDSTLHKPMTPVDWEKLYLSIGIDPHAALEQAPPRGQLSGANYLAPPQNPSAFPGQFQNQSFGFAGQFPAQGGGAGQGSTGFGGVATPQPAANVFAKQSTAGQASGFPPQGQQFPPATQQVAQQIPPAQPVNNPFGGGQAQPVSNPFGGGQQFQQTPPQAQVQHAARIVPDQGANTVPGAEVGQEDLEGLIDG